MTKKQFPKPFDFKAFYKEIGAFQGNQKSDADDIVEQLSNFKLPNGEPVVELLDCQWEDCDNKQKTLVEIKPKGDYFDLMMVCDRCYENIEQEEC